MSFSFGYLACSALIALTLVYGRALLGVLGQRFRTETRRERVERSEVPADVLAVFERESAPLEELGFAEVGFMRAESVLAGSKLPVWYRVLQHPERKSFAGLALSSAPTAARRCELAFLAQADEGRRIETAPLLAGALHRRCAKHVVIEAGTADAARVWERHQAEVAARPDFAPRDVSLDELLVEEAQVAKCSLSDKLASRRFALAGEGLFRFTVWGALARMLFENRRLRRKRAALHKEQPATRPESPEAGVAADLVAHRHREGLEASSQSSWALKLGLFLASAIAMGVAFGLTLSFETAAIVFAVLLVHESGHALAMKLFGYRNVQMLFIPLFGAIAHGQKRDVAPWQELVVLLAGPVPGIIAGTALLLSARPDQPSWLEHTTLVLLYLNYFNLLPILPLDGGQILNLALFERFPRAQVAFSALSAVALMVWSGGNVLFVVGLLMLVGIPAQLRSAGLLARARARLAALGRAAEPADPLRVLYAELREQPRKLNPNAKYVLVKEVAAQLLRRPAGAGLASATLVGWLAIMSLPLGLVRYAPVEGNESLAAAVEAGRAREVAEWKAKVAAAATPEEEVRVRTAAAEALFARWDLDHAREQLEPALALSKKLREPELEASAQLWLARIELAPFRRPFGAMAPAETLQRAERHLRRALDLREQRFGVESREVAEVLEAFPPDDPPDRVGALVRALRLAAIYERELANDPPLRWKLVSVCETEALLRERGGDHASAEAALQRGLALAEQRGGDHPELQLDALRALTGFYFLRERYTDLRPLLERQAELLKRATGARVGPVPDSDPCWLDYWSGNAEAAGRCFADAREKLAQLPDDPRGGAWLGLESTLDEATARARAGDRAGAEILLRRAQQIVAGSDVSLDLYLRDQPHLQEDFTGVERDRRRAERGRVLAPLLDTRSS